MLQICRYEKVFRRISHIFVEMLNEMAKSNPLQCYLL